MSNPLISFIHFDLYEKRVSLLMGRNNSTTTLYSKIITKIIIILICYYFVHELVKVIRRENIKTNIVSKKTFSRTPIFLNSNNYKFAFTVQSDGKMISDRVFNQYFSPKFTLFSRKSNTSYYDNVINRTHISFRKCNKEYFNFEEDYIEFNELHNYLCPEDFNFSIQGFYDEKISSSIIFKLDICQNTSIIQNCKPIEEIKEKLNGAELLIYLQDNDIDSFNYYNPIVSSLKYIYYAPLDVKKFHYEELFLQSIEIITDDSYWTSNYVINNTFRIHEQKNIFEIGGENTTFFQLVLTPHDKNITITRNYYKIFEIFSGTGGIAKILMIIGFLLTYKFNKTKELEKLINSNYIDANQSLNKHTSKVKENSLKNKQYYFNL